MANQEWRVVPAVDVAQAASLVVVDPEEQGREVFALPGRVDCLASQGCLDLIRDGTGLVEVTAISFDPKPASGQTLRAESSTSTVAGPVAPAIQAREAAIFVQVGAFGDPENARRRFSELRDSGLAKAFVIEDTSRSPALYRVRIGPIADVEQYDALVVHLRNMGITESHLVTD